jgi:ribosomal protein S18 acetylase RimI-like enzyme
MEGVSLIERTPWDAAALGLATYELRELSAEVLATIHGKPGHYTARVDPLASKKLLHEHGFYYSDTLIQPYCSAGDFVRRPNNAASVTRTLELERALSICHGAFQHDRFHRDFNVARPGADARYDRWLTQLYHDGQVYGLVLRGELAGFAAVVEGRLVLHAIAKRFRGKNLAAGLWTALCDELFAAGLKEITSSISACNLPALNLYSSLGFRFRHAVDVYHRMIV